jgi:hypothetical protein
MSVHDADKCCFALHRRRRTGMQRSRGSVRRAAPALMQKQRWGCRTHPCRRQPAMQNVHPQWCLLLWQLPHAQCAATSPTVQHGPRSKALACIPCSIQDRDVHDVFVGQKAAGADSPGAAAEGCRAAAGAHLNTCMWHTYVPAARSDSYSTSSECNQSKALLTQDCTAHACWHSVAAICAAGKAGGECCEASRPRR